MQKKNILAIGAHPDDIEAKCGGTLLKYKADGHNIFFVLTTSGNIGSNDYQSREEIALIREKEQLASAKLYDAEVRFLRFDDELLLDTPETRRSVLNAMRWANPDVIFTHDLTDTSTDHPITGKIVSEVILSLSAKLVPADEPPIDKKPSLFYWDNGAGIHFVPEVYVDISENMDTKMDSIAKHQSQFKWMENFVDEFLESYRTISRFRGIQSGCNYAEAFRAFRLRGYMPDFKLLP